MYCLEAVRVLDFGSIRLLTQGKPCIHLGYVCWARCTRLIVPKSSFQQSVPHPIQPSSARASSSVRSPYNPMRFIRPLMITRKTQAYPTFMATLTDLPTEILYEIANQVLLTDTNLLYTLSLVCHRLQAVYLPIFLESFGIYDPTRNLQFKILGDSWPPSNLSFATNVSPFPSFPPRNYTYAPLSGPPPSTQSHHPLDALSALNVAFYLTKLRRLHIQFIQDSDHVRVLQQQLKRVTRFASRLTTIEEVCLIFNKPGQNYHHFGGDVDTALYNWTIAFGGLLNVVLEKGCQSLSIQYGAALTHCYHFGRVRTIPSLVSANAPLTATVVAISNAVTTDANLQNTVPSVLEGPGWRFYRSPVDDSPSRHMLVHLSPSLVSPNPSSPSSFLTHFTLSSPMLLRPPCSQWTISLLHNSPISHLTLSDLYLFADIWSAMLPLVFDAVADKVESLTIKECNVPWEELLRVLRDTQARGYTGSREAVGRRDEKAKWKLKELILDRSMKAPPVPQMPLVSSNSFGSPVTSSSSGTGIISNLLSRWSIPKLGSGGSHCKDPGLKPIPGLQHIEILQAPSQWVLYFLAVPDAFCAPIPVGGPPPTNGTSAPGTQPPSPSSGISPANVIARLSSRSRSRQSNPNMNNTATNYNTSGNNTPNFYNNSGSQSRNPSRTPSCMASACPSPNASTLHIPFAPKGTLSRLRVLPYETSQTVTHMIRRLTARGLQPEIEVICPEPVEVQLPVTTTRPGVQRGSMVQSTHSPPAVSVTPPAATTASSASISTQQTERTSSKLMAIGGNQLIGDSSRLHSHSHSHSHSGRQNGHNHHHYHTSPHHQHGQQQRKSVSIVDGKGVTPPPSSSSGVGSGGGLKHSLSSTSSTVTTAMTTTPMHLMMMAVPDAQAITATPTATAPTILRSMPVSYRILLDKVEWGFTHGQPEVCASVRVSSFNTCNRLT